MSKGGIPKKYNRLIVGILSAGIANSSGITKISSDGFPAAKTAEEDNEIRNRINMVFEYFAIN